MTKTRTIIGLLVLAAALAGPPAWTAEPQGSARLEDGVHALFDALAAGDDGHAASLVCLGRLGAEVRARAQKAGLIAQAASPALVAAYDAAYLAALHQTFDRALEGGAVVREVDTRAIDDTVTAGETGLISDPATSVTATGLVRVSLRGQDGPLDIAVIRLGATWCLDPVTVQPHAL